ncbi:MAG TPA: DNA starvation/stationary phase protection protein [Acidimicrobiales bacterium]|nr:DNA starvation/stationary phase protection protein [Acidimicrobiales bacterium]
MTQIGIPDVAVEGREEIASALQEALVDLVALSLNGKQAHWQVTGRHFVPVHEQLDAIVTDARDWSDLVAERAITLGVPVDGRPDTVARTAVVGDFPEGFVDDDKAVAVVTQQVEQVVARMRARAHELGERDVVTQDVIIEILRGLEKHLWMLQAQLV